MRHKNQCIDFARDKIDRTNVYLTESVNNHAKNQFFIPYLKSRVNLDLRMRN